MRTLRRVIAKADLMLQIKVWDRESQATPGEIASLIDYGLVVDCEATGVEGTGENSQAYFSVSLLGSYPTES